MQRLALAAWLIAAIFFDPTSIVHKQQATARLVGFLCTILAGALYGIMLSVLAALAQVVADAATPSAVTLGEVPRLKQWHEHLDEFGAVFVGLFYFQQFSCSSYR